MTPPPPSAAVAAQPEKGCDKHHLIHCSQCQHDRMVSDLRSENERLHAQVAALTQGAAAKPAENPLHQHLLDMLGAKDHEDAARIIAGHHARELAASQGAAERAVPAEPVATLHCNGEGYVSARVTEAGKRMRFEDPIALHIAASPAQPAERAVPAAAAPLEELLVWAVEDGVIRMSDVFKLDLQDAIEKFARRFASPAQPAPEPADDGCECANCAHGMGECQRLPFDTPDQPAPAQGRVQKPTENEHVAADVSKNGQESNMAAAQPLAPAAGVVRVCPECDIAGCRHMRTAPAATADALDAAIDAFEQKQRGIPQAHIAAQLVAELRAALVAQKEGK